MGDIRITWTPDTQAITQRVQYRVQPDVTFIIPSGANNLGPSVAEFTVNDLADGNTYCFTITTVCNSGEFTSSENCITI